MGNIAVAAHKIKEFTRQVFIHAGLSGEDAELVSSNLAEAELRGIYSHGYSKVSSYVNHIKSGFFNSRPHITVLQESASTLLVDGDYAMGAVSGTKAMQLCVDKGRQTGFACASVRKGRHFGMAAFYAKLALEQGMIGVSLCSSGRIMSSFGGTTRVLGTNPICIAVPSGQQFPFIFDAATSEAAYNKIVVAAREGRDIPTGWALDEDGHPTTDAQKALNGMVIPFGGYKGSGLAIMVNVLSAVLSNAVGYADGSWQSGQEAPGYGDVGFFFCALDVGRFQPLDAFTKEVDGFIEELKSVRKQRADQEIYVPGELEYLRQQRNLARGIAIGKGVYEDLREIGIELDVPFDVRWPGENLHEEGAHVSDIAL